MGVLVTQKKDAEILIIDGQQRINTLSSLALAVLSCLNTFGRQRVSNFCSPTILGTDPESLKPYSKLANF